MSVTRRSIGKYEFRDADYRQILLWSKALKLDLAKVVEALASGVVHDRKGSKLEFAVQDGGGCPEFCVNGFEVSAVSCGLQTG